MNLLQLLISLQRQRAGLAIVLDEFGGTAGIVTTEVFWKRWSAKSAAKLIVKALLEKLDNGRWRISGRFRLDDFRREYPASGSSRDRRSGA
jgi:putative hemolysin